MPRLCRSSQNRVASFNPSLPDGDIHLSDARANSAAQAPRDHGVSAKLWADGYGGSNPIASNATATGRAKNRHLEIRLVRRSKRLRICTSFYE